MPADDERGRVLEQLYAGLRGAVDEMGFVTLAKDGSPKLNPAVGELRRVIAELDRRAAAQPAATEQPEEVTDPNDLRAVLRAIG